MRQNQFKPFAAIIFVSLILLSTGLVAQTFELKDYKNPDFHLKMLETDFSFISNSNGSRQTYSGSQTYPERRFDDFQIGGMLRPTYYSRTNLRNYQGNQSIEIGLQSEFRKQSSEFTDLSGSQSQDSKRSTYLGDLYYRTSNRFYNNKKQFFEVDATFFYTFYSAASSYNQEPKSEIYTLHNANSQHQGQISVPLLIGKGRMEEVQDARLALYIFEDLKKSGNLKHEPLKEEIIAFAEFITKLKNERHFDARLRKISDITAVDSMLRAMDLKQGAETSWFTLINDNWDFAEGPIREAGSRFSIGVVPVFFFNKETHKSKISDNSGSDNTFTEKMRANNMGADIMIDYRLSVPTSYNWQHDTYAQAVFSPLNTYLSNSNYQGDSLISEQENYYREPSFGVEVGHTIGYYPNSRTSVFLHGELDYRYLYKSKRKVDTLEEEESNNYLSAQLRLQGIYYFSPQLTFNATLAGQLANASNSMRAIQTSAELTSHNLNFYSQISLGFTYKLF